MHASALRYCDAPADLSAQHKGTLFAFAGIIKDELERASPSVALVARSGLDLKRFDVRYSHAGLSLKASTNGAWSVRQLYYACDEHLPRIFDQGMSGFVLGTEDPHTGFVSIVLLPEDAAQALAQAALDNAHALELLSLAYSANAFAYSTRYQNCNQWVIELMASAWGASRSREHGRDLAQAWLQDRHYQPSIIDVHYRPLMWFGSLIPWIHGDDHPMADLAANRYLVSMPASIEAFVHDQFPQAQRIEFCHADKHAVIHHGWTPVREDCEPASEDTVLVLE